MNVKVEWNKIVTNAISTLVAVVFIGAASIVWKGATTVDEKVSANRADIEHLVNALSDRLSEYHMSHNQITNAIYELYQRQSALEEKLSSLKSTDSIISKALPPKKEGIITEPLLPLREDADGSTQTRQNIYKSLKR